MQWAVDAFKYLGGMSWWAGFLTFLGSAASLLFTYLTIITRKKRLVLEKEQLEIDKAFAAVRAKGANVTEEDAKTAVRALPGGDTADDWKRRYTEAEDRASRMAALAERRQETIDALRDTLDDVKIKLKSQEQLEADIARMHGEVSKAHLEADARVQKILDEDVAPLRARVRELEQENAEILSGNLRVCREEPPDLRRDQIITPVSGLHKSLPPVRVPKLPPLPAALDGEVTPRPRGLPERPRKR